ncbi:MAG: NuoM family protein [Dehalococcoidia bacterium]
MITSDLYYLNLVVLVPFISALLILLIPSSYSKYISSFAAVATGITLILATYLCANYYFTESYATGQFYPLSSIEWLPSLGITFQLGVDGISALMILLNGLVAFGGTLVATRITHRNKEFFVLYLLLVSGVNGVFLSLDLFFFFFFYELAVIPMYLLIAVWGSSTDFRTFTKPENFSRTKEYSAMKLVIYLSLGSVLVWVAFIGLYMFSDIKTFDFMILRDQEFDRMFQIVMFPLIAIGFGSLAGLWPFHTWSPDGHVAAPTSVSMLHAGVLMKLGAYGILRIGMELMPEGAEFWMPAIVLLATVNVVYGAISAMGQNDLKYVIGYSSVSHMGYVLLGLATLNVFGVNGAVLQMFAHGIMTALFFIVVGGIYERTHTRDIGVLEGLFKNMSKSGLFFVIAGLASLGLPGLSGFAAELLVFIGAFQYNPIIGSLSIFAAAITAVYILRLIGKVFFGPIDDRWKSLTDSSRTEYFAGALLIAFIVGVGIWPFPWINLIDGSVSLILGIVP